MTDIGQKVEHVRLAMNGRQHGGHVCHWPGCKKRVPPALWGCRAHWFKLPKILRDKIWRTYRTGQEISKTPSRAYVETAREVAQWIETHKGDV